MSTEFDPQLGYEQERINKKERVVSEIQRKLESVITGPFSFLIYGSVARGIATAESDIDSMIIFPRNDIEKVVRDDVIFSLPLDNPSASQNQLSFYDDQDRNDLMSGALDFIRVEAFSSGEEIELQFFPYESLTAACTVGKSCLVAGKKNLSGIYSVSDPDKISIEQTYNGQRFEFRKSPHIALSGRRLDTSECGMFEHEGHVTRGVSLEKLLCPRLLVDRLGLRDFIDNRVLRDFIYRVFQSRGLFVYDSEGKPVAMKDTNSAYEIIMDFLGATKTNKPEAKYELGPNQAADFKSRISAQLQNIIQTENLEVVNER